MSSLSPIQKTAYRAGVIVSLLVTIWLLSPLGQGWQQPGPDNIGHEAMECEACHTPADGGIIGSVRHWMDPQAEEAWFAKQPVANAQCLDCHLNETDRHPVDQFLKPRFDQARTAIAPQYCVSCHSQHQASRATVELGICRHCHQDLDIEEDPIEVPHVELVSDQRWDTCLGCHDFHGNHDGETPLRMAQVMTEAQIQEYLDGGRSPYGYRKLTVMQTMQVKQE